MTEPLLPPPGAETADRPALTTTGESSTTPARGASGHKIPRALWPEIVRRVEAREFKTAIAAEFDVSPRNIYAICARTRPDILRRAQKAGGAARPKIRPEDRPEICRRVANGERKAVVALDYDVTERAIYTVVRKEAEAHLTSEQRRALREKRRQSHLARVQRRALKKEKRLAPARPGLEAFLDALDAAQHPKIGGGAGGKHKGIEPPRPGHERVARLLGRFRGDADGDGQGDSASRRLLQAAAGFGRAGLQPARGGETALAHARTQLRRAEADVHFAAGAAARKRKSRRP